MRPVSQIQEFRLDGFKSFFSETILRLSPLTMLVGPNASGKSNLIEGMRLLRWLARGGRLDDLARAMSYGELDIRGRLSDLIGRTDLGEPDPTGFSLGCSLPPKDVEGWTDLRAYVVLTDPGPRVQWEWIKQSPGGPLLYGVEVPARDDGHVIQVAYNDFTAGEHKPRITCTDQQLVLTQLGTPSGLGQTHRDSQRVIPAVTNAFRESLSSISFLEPVTRSMRGYANIADEFLMEDGRNLSGVLYHLCRPEGGQKDAVLRFVSDLPEQEIADISFVRPEQGETRLQFDENFATRIEKRDVSVLSDGTLRVLAAAAILLSAREGSLVVMEEIDNGVHPNRAKLLLENILAVAKRRSLSVLVTAHNPALLDALPTEAIPKVACCYREPGTNYSRIKHIEDLDSSPELLARGPLGTLATSGALERYLKDGRTPDEKAKAALAWLDKFQRARR